MSDSTTSNEAEPENQLNLQQIFTKSSTFQSYVTPAALKGEWKPEIKMEINARHQVIEPNQYEVIVKAKVTATSNDNPAFEVEVRQAGIFTLKGFEEPQLDYMLGAYCPNAVFPFLRQVISDAVVHGGFPQLLLVPINFDALYQAQLKEKEKKQGAPAKITQAAGEAKKEASTIQ